VQNFQNYINSLNSINSRTATAEDIITLGDIVSALGNEDLTSTFESYFANELEKGQEGNASSQTTTTAQP